MATLSAAKRLVVKIGSALLVGGGAPRTDWLARMAGDLAALRKAGAQVIVVSSGAIALGAGRLALPKGGRGSLADAQAAARLHRLDVPGVRVGQAGRGYELAGPEHPDAVAIGQPVGEAGRARAVRGWVIRSEDGRLESAAAGGPGVR